MRNKKFLKAIFGTFMCAAMAVSAASVGACKTGNPNDGDDSGNTDHTHTYSDVWSSDGTHHWHAPTCDDTTEVKDKEAHKWYFGSCTVCDAEDANPKVLNPTLSEADDNDPVPDENGQIVVEYETSSLEFDMETLAEDKVKSIFTISKGVEVRSRNRTYGTQKFDRSFKLGSIKVHASAPGTLEIIVENGSSSASAAALAINGKDYEYNKSGLQKIEVEITEVGDYTIAKSNSTGMNSTNDVYTLKYITKSAVTPVEKIEVENGGTVDYFLGQAFSASSLAVNAIYETSGTIKAIPVGRLTVDYSNFDSSKSGEYPIYVSYEKGGKTYYAEYTVTVYDLKSLSLSTFTTNGTKQTTLKQVYIKDSTFSTAGLTVTAKTECGEQTADFRLDASRYTISAPDMTTTGEKTVTITSKDNENVTATFKIYVWEQVQAVNNEITVTVNPTEAVSSTNFHTVTQALQYVASYGANVIKTINIADGEYYEKISVDVPNVHLEGSGTNTPNATVNNGVVLWYDALAGLADASGKAYGTNGSGSVTITSDATGFVAHNITFKNYYNTNELYNESRGMVADTQACALVVESASASFYNCKMTGYHDTLYSNKGNHYYYNCWIEGRTDYIFGSDAKAYFHNCTINTVSAGSQDGNGGYVVALKPSNSSYYFVFNGCEFTGAESGATNIALGRAWGADMKMVVLNSGISANYSKEAHTATTSKGQRYCTMSGNEPKPENMLEYNNTGDGAISSSIANTCTYMDETTAGAYQSGKISAILGFTPVNPDAQSYQVTVISDTGVELGKITVENGKALTEEQIKAVIASNATYGAYDIVGIYSDDICESEYAYPAINAEGKVYVKLHLETAFVSNTAISFGSAGNYSNLLGTKLVVGGNAIKDNGGNNSEIGEGTEFTIKVKAGAKVSVSSYNDYTYYTVKIDGEVYTADPITATSWTFNAVADCDITFVGGRNPENSHSNYFYSINISYGLTEITATSEKKTFTSSEGIDSTDYIEFSGVSDHQSGTYWNLGKTGTIKIKVSAGATITLNCSYWGVGITINGVDQGALTNGTPIVYTATEGGEIIIGCVPGASNVSYLQSIAVSYSA